MISVSQAKKWFFQLWNMLKPRVPGPSFDCRASVMHQCQIQSPSKWFAFCGVHTPSDKHRLQRCWRCLSASGRARMRGNFPTPQPQRRPEGPERLTFSTMAPWAPWGLGRTNCILWGLVVSGYKPSLKQMSQLGSSYHYLYYIKWKNGKETVVENDWKRLRPHFLLV